MPDMSGSIITLVAFVRLFSSVYFQMCSIIWRSRGWTMCPTALGRKEKNCPMYTLCTGCICLTFLHCVISYETSKNLDQSSQTHTGCICLTFPRCVFSNVTSNCLPEKRHSHIGCIYLAFLHCVFSYETSKSFDQSRQTYTGCICSNFLHSQLQKKDLQ